MDDTKPEILSYSMDQTGKWFALDADEILHRNDSVLSWIHIDYSQEEALLWISEHARLDPVTLESIIDQGTRPRSVMMKDGLLVILRGVNCNPGQDPEDMVAVRMLFSENVIYTARNRKVMAIRDVKEAVERGEGPASKGDFLVVVAERIADRMGDIIQDLEETVDEMEDFSMDTSHSDLLSKITDIRRATINLRRYIAPQRDAFQRILNERVSWIEATDRIRLKEIAERTARFVEDIDSIKERAKLILEEINNNLSTQMNKAIYILSIITAIFLPLSLLTGLLGINVGGIPGSDYKWAFTFVTIAILAIAGILYLLLRKIKWL